MKKILLVAIFTAVVAGSAFAGGEALAGLKSNATLPADSIPLPTPKAAHNASYDKSAGFRAAKGAASASCDVAEYERVKSALNKIIRSDESTQAERDAAISARDTLTIKLLDTQLGGCRPVNQGVIEYEKAREALNKIIRSDRSTQAERDAAISARDELTVNFIQQLLDGTRPGTD